MNSIVRTALVQRLKSDGAYSSSGKPRLWASEAGGCARRAMLRIQGYQPTREFPLTAKEAMQNGKMFEVDTEDALLRTYGAARIQAQGWLGNDKWSCKVDFLLDGGTDHPVIIEHKAQADKWWNFNGSIPKREHVIQLLLYRHLYEEKFGVSPQLLLFYRSWGHYAELEVTTLDMADGIARIEAAGEMDGEHYQKAIALDADDLRKTLEYYYTNNILPDPFPTKQEGLCTFKGEPSCPMYGHCWKD